MINSCHSPTCCSMVQGKRAMPMGISSDTLAYRVIFTALCESRIQCLFCST
uniref:Uncharacterized protein n=1 Tax=Arundo donax TaxID=35708 RepID=A0A0A9F371_ARUDO